MSFILISCQEGSNHYISLVYDGYNNSVTYYDASKDAIGTFNSKTEVKISANQTNVPEGFTRIETPTTNVLVKSSNIREKKIEVRKIRDGEFERLPTFPEKLNKAGSNLSANVFNFIDELHFYKSDFNGITWTIIMIISAFIGWGVMAFATNEDSYILALIGVGSMVLAYFSGFVLFGIHEFDDSLTTNLGWFMDLLCFLGIIGAAYIMLETFSTTMSIIVPYTMDLSSDSSMAGFNTVIQWFLLFLYGISLWLFKSIADYILWAMIIVQGIFSLYIIIISFKNLIIIPPLLYTILFPMCFIFMAVSVLTVGWMVFVLAIMVVAFGSILSQPNNSNGEIIGIKVTDGMGITVFEDKWK